MNSDNGEPNCTSTGTKQHMVKQMQLAFIQTLMPVRGREQDTPHLNRDLFYAQGPFSPAPSLGKGLAKSHLALNTLPHHLRRFCIPESTGK